jgi:2-polyprenyl-6-hydroxyphenyl methylase/3-demethylubiquinone-9 3-methyltransferase
MHGFSNLTKQISQTLAQGAEFHESLARGWSAGYESGGFKRRIAVFESLLQTLVQPGELWLDAGCGSGRLARIVARLGARVVAVDGSPSMIECAQRESQALDDNISYQQVATIEALEFPDSHFDKLLCSSVLEYLEKPEQALAEFSRLLRPGGVLLVSVPNRYSPIRLAQLLIRNSLKWFGKNFYPYLAVSKNSYSQAAINQLLDKTGFSVQAINYFDPLLPATISRFFLGSLIILTCQRKL